LRREEKKVSIGQLPVWRGPVAERLLEVAPLKPATNLRNLKVEPIHALPFSPTDFQGHGRRRCSFANHRPQITASPANASQ
jgi:hypothetical protein